MGKQKTRRDMPAINLQDLSVMADMTDKACEASRESPANCEPSPSISALASTIVDRPEADFGILRKKQRASHPV